MKIKEIAELYNVTPYTLRYYEKIGLLKPQYLENGYRYYTYEHIQVLNTIRDLRFFNLPLSKIQDYLTTKSVNKTLEILAFELKSLEATITEAKNKTFFLKERVDMINLALKTANTKMQIINHPQRVIVTGKNRYMDEKHFYYELKSLHNLHTSILHSSNQNLFGSVVYEEKNRYSYQAFYFAHQSIKQKCDTFSIIPEGEYLTYTYSGEYKQTKELVEIMNRYMTNFSLQPKGPFYEIYLIDFHETNNKNEFVTQFEILLNKKRTDIIRT